MAARVQLKTTPAQRLSVSIPTTRTAQGIVYTPLFVLNQHLQEQVRSVRMERSASVSTAAVRAPIMAE